MNNIYQYLKDYLLKYSQAEVYGLGKFEIVYKSSYEHPVLHTFTIPGKYVVFKEMKTEDTDFAYFVSKQTGGNIENAIQLIKEWTEKIRKTVESKQTFPVGTMGEFTSDAMRRMVFISKPDTDISPQSFGLEEFTAQLPSISIPPISIPVQDSRTSQTPPAVQPTKPIQTASPSPVFDNNLVKEPKQTAESTEQPIAKAEETKAASEETKVTSEESKEVFPKEKHRKGFIFLRTSLILLCLLIGVVGLVYQFAPNSIDRYKSVVEKWITPTVVPTEDSLDTTDKNIPTLIYPQENVSISTKIEETPGKSIPKESQPTPYTGHYVILGSFMSKENADNYLRQQRAKHSNIQSLGKGKTSNMYMVGIGPYSKEEAELQASKITNSWVLKM